MNPPPKFNRRAFGQLWRIFWAYFSGRKRVRAWWMLGGLIGLSLTVAWVAVRANQASGTIFTALEKVDESGYYRGLWLYLGTLLASIPCAAFYKYLEERLGLAWREDLTATLIRRYFHNRAYYHLNSSEEIDNPDQRIAEDVKNFTTTTLSFLLIILNSAIQTVAFTGVLWSISRQLVWVVMGYALFGTLVALWIGRRLVGLNYRQFEREANLRHSLIRVRDHAESIAFYRGERREMRDLRGRLMALVENAMKLIGWNRNLAFFTTGYNSFALILPVIVVAPLYLKGTVAFGDITRGTQAFGTVLAAVSLIITQFERLSTFAAGVTRLGSLWEHLDERDAEDDLEAEEQRIETREGRCEIELEGLTVRTPTGERELLRDVDLKVPDGSSLLIMGPSGSGKSSLLRTIAGLWTTGSGSIERPPYRELMFLPQRPYVNEGTLREQLEYPGKEGAVPDEELKKALEAVNLSEVLERVGGDFGRRADWGSMLSLGEQQRLSFARLILRQPLIAFLDESTSALDEPNEKLLYELMRERGQTYISVGHRSTLKAYHDRLLLIDREGGWEVEPLDHEAQAVG